MQTQTQWVKIQTPAHWNLIARSRTAPPPLSSPSSVLRANFVS